MFKRVLSCVAIVASSLLLGPNAAMAQRGGSQCLGPDSTSAAVVDFVRKLIKGTNIHIDSLRDNVGLAGLDTSFVTVVTSSKTCASAATAMDQLLKVSPSGWLLYVIQAGTGTRTRLIVEDPNDKAGEWLRAWVFDSHFNFLKAILK